MEQILLIKSSIPSWRILFLIEGLPTMLMTIVAFFMLPDSICDARFLSAREKEVGSFIVNEGQIADTEKGEHNGVRIKELLAGLKDWRSFVTGVIYFGCNVSNFTESPELVPYSNQALIRCRSRVCRSSSQASSLRSASSPASRQMACPRRRIFSVSLLSLLSISWRTGYVLGALS